MALTSDVEQAARLLAGSPVRIDTFPLDGGSSASVSRLEVVDQDGKTATAIFRQHSDRVSKGHDRSVAKREFLVTDELHRIGLPVPKPFGWGDGEPDTGSWLLTEFVGGHPAAGRSQSLAVLEQMAEFLVRLHEVDPEVVRSAELDMIEDPVAAIPTYLPDSALGARVARLLASGFRRAPNPACVLHGDYWPGNVMFDGGRLAAVFDWEDVKLGDPLVDLACARVELTCDAGSEACDEFASQYLEARPQVDTTDLALWDVYVSVTALSAMHLWGLSAEDETRRRSATSAFLDAATQRLND